MSRRDSFAWVQVKSEEARVRIEVAGAAIAATLPVVFAPRSEGDRVVAPSPLLWGSLFSVLPRDKRPCLKNACLGQAGDLLLHFSGERLGQDDLDVFLALLHLAQGVPLGNPVQIVGGALLRQLGLTDTGGRAGPAGGNGSRDRLEASLWRLASAMIQIRGGRGEVFMGHLLASAERGRYGEAWRVTLARELAPAFSIGLAGLDLRARRALRGKPLAGWLHAWMSSHGHAPHPHSLSKLRVLSGCTSTPKEFRRLLAKSLQVLDRVHKDFGEVGLKWSIQAGTLAVRRMTLANANHFNAATPTQGTAATPTASRRDAHQGYAATPTAE